MATPEVYPFASIENDDGRGSFPSWIRGLRKQSGVYIIRDLDSRAIWYVGESSSNRLYSTLTRHFQAWTNKYETAGATYDREDIEVAVIIVPKSHARHLQNELICVLDPADNRLKCDQLFDEGDPESSKPPRGYDYDVDLLLEGIIYQWTDDDHDDLADVPF
jgi:hypothetical protein